MKICLVNDTRSCHSGSAQVMDNIYALFSDHTIVKEAWWKHTNMYDWMVVNGEGTMHDNAYRAIIILKMMRYAKDHGKKVALINTVWQNMHHTECSVVSDIDLITVREIRSYSEIKNLNGNAMVFPDLSFLFPAEHDKGRTPRINPGLINGMKAAKSITHGEAPYKIIFYNIDIPMYSIRRGDKFYNQISDISMLDVYLTGQHHGVYAALMAGTPFLATPGNTHKIESLFEWAECNIPICKSSDDIFHHLDKLEIITKEENRLSEFVLSKRHEAEIFLRDNVR